MQTWHDRTRQELAEMHRQAEIRRQAQLEAEQANKRRVFHLRLVPIEQRLSDLYESMPDEEKPKRRQMRFFTDALAAKYRTRSGKNQASVAEIGPALTRLGWTRKREWLGAEQTFRTWWYPPAKDNEGD